MSVHILNAAQKLPISIDEAWDFFSSPHNLKEITPPYMGFIIQSGADTKMYNGQLISYKVSPVLGIPLTWVTRIEDVNSPFSFVDTQLKGPYQLWRHKHTFMPIAGGVLMTDHIEYQLPLGFLGDIAHLIFVRRQLEGIFSYRKQVLEERFGKF